MHRWQEHLLAGQVIPAVPLALHEDGSWSQRHQQALVRYYVAAGAGGLAVGVHATQFAIREPRHGLFESVLSLTADTLTRCLTEDSGFVRIAGICGRTAAAVGEAEFARGLGYHAGLLSLTALADAAESQLLEHCRTVADVIPIVGFYLQPAVGGRHLSYRFWRELCDIESLAAIKIAPFNRYFTGDVVRAVIDSGRTEIALYTGNDDNILVDLLTPFCFSGTTRFIVGGLLGQWGVWTRRAVEQLESVRLVRGQATLESTWLQLNAALTDANSAVFDANNSFAGCIAGINEVLRRQGLMPSHRCLDPGETMSYGQVQEIERVIAAYPFLIDDEFVQEHRHEWLSP